MFILNVLPSSIFDYNMHDLCVLQFDPGQWALEAGRRADGVPGPGHTHLLHRTAGTARQEAGTRYTYHCELSPFTDRLIHF